MRAALFGLLFACAAAFAEPQVVPEELELSLMREKVAEYRAQYGTDNHVEIIAALERYFPKRRFVWLDNDGRYVVQDDRRDPEIFRFEL